jgi:hypothetical protein
LRDLDAALGAVVGLPVVVHGAADVGRLDLGGLAVELRADLVDLPGLAQLFDLATYCLRR